MMEVFTLFTCIFTLIAVVAHHLHMVHRQIEVIENPLFAFYAKLNDVEYLVTVLRITQYSPQGPLYRWIRLNWRDDEGIPCSIETFLDEQAYAEYISHAFAS